MKSQKKLKRITIKKSNMKLNLKINKRVRGKKMQENKQYTLRKQKKKKGGKKAGIPIDELTDQAHQKKNYQHTK